MDSQAIEQLVYFDIIATVLGKFEGLDLPKQSWLRGKLPLFNQLIVPTAWGTRGLGWVIAKSQVSAVQGGLSFVQRNNILSTEFYLSNYLQKGVRLNVHLYYIPSTIATGFTISFPP